MIGDHPVKLRAPDFLGGGPDGALLRRTDQNFVEGLFRDLRTEEGRARLSEQRLDGKPDGDVLYQPVHRCHTLLVVEAFCEVPGQPPLSRRKIDGAGLVVRRVVEGSSDRRGAEAASSVQRWLMEEHAVLGWRAASPTEVDEDPDPERRVLPTTGNAEVDAWLAATRLQQTPRAEQITRLHLVPPDICKALKRTLLFGVVPTGDAQVAERVRLSGTEEQVAENDQTPGSPLSVRYSQDDVARMTPGWLRQSAGRALPGALAGYHFEVVDLNAGSFSNGLPNPIPKLVLRRSTDTHARWVERGIYAWHDEGQGSFSPLPGPGSPHSQGTGSPGLGAATEDGTSSLVGFITSLWQLRFQLRAFETMPGPDGRPVDAPDAANFRAALAGLNVTLADGRVQDLYGFLRDASAVLVLREPGRLVMPWRLPAISGDTEGGVRNKVSQALTRQLARLARSESRYANGRARYAVRAFLRVRCEGDCPSRLVWAEASTPRRVARWYEGGPDDAVLPQIELPTLNRGFLKTLKPNVSVKVPPSLFNFIQNNAPKSFLNPEDLRRNANGPAIQWICGFNISIIFIIAFMLLITFVLLLNIVFWWIFFFRICIPLPSGTPNPDEDHR